MSYNASGTQTADYNPSKHLNQVFKIFKSYPEVFPDTDIAELAKELQNPGNQLNIKVVVLDENSQAIGYIEAKQPTDTDTTWNIYWLAVSKDSRHNGTGTQLMTEIYKRIKAKGIGKIFVETCGCDGCISARNFYVKHGFKVVGILPDYYLEGHSKVVFFKSAKI